jgi:hypothetical protein
MAEAKKVKSKDVLRKEPRRDSDVVVSPAGEELLVLANEVVNTGAKPSQDEVLPDRTITWVFVEATGGQLQDLRKGFLSNGNLGPVGDSVPTTEVFQFFHEQVGREDFGNTCYSQANLNDTNPAYLYALAFALSGEQWSATDVKTDDPADAPAFGVYRFTKETWQRLISEPEALGILPDEIKFPDIQCAVAAIVAGKSATKLKSLITRPLSAVDLFLAQLCADTTGFGSKAAATILQAEQDNKTSEEVIQAIYPDSAVRTAFFKRYDKIFLAGGATTIKNALAMCAQKIESGFAQVRILADQVESRLFASIPLKPTDPILGGDGGDGGTGIGTGGGPTGTVTGVGSGIDRRQFLDELKKPAIVRKLADMVKGEVGSSAPHDTKLVQLETAFNRAMARGQSLAHVLLSKSEDRKFGYYQGGPRGTYSRPVTDAEFEDFKKTLLPEVLAGSNKSKELLGIIATGNASGQVAADQVAAGTRGGTLKAAGGERESYFVEGPLKFPFKFFQGGESISLPSGLSSSGSTAPGGEPPEHMDGDTEGSGPVGGKFNVEARHPMSPDADQQKITLSNSQRVTVNKAVAEQFRGFFNDLIKHGAPVRDLGGFGMRDNRSQHPIGYAIDWAQHRRDVVDADVSKWIKDNRDLLKKLERRWGMSGAENWRDRDTGHFSIERVLGEQHLAASRKASASD